MNFEEFQEKSRETAIYPDKDRNIMYPTLGLAGEAGEVAGAVKKIFRDDDGRLSDDRKNLIADGLGDSLWYIAQIASEANLKLEDIAKANISKLQDRKNRGALKGDGHFR